MCSIESFLLLWKKKKERKHSSRTEEEEEEAHNLYIFRLSAKKKIQTQSLSKKSSSSSIFGIFTRVFYSKPPDKKIMFAIKAPVVSVVASARATQKAEKKVA